MKIIKLLPRSITGYSKHTPQRGQYKELYFNNRKPMFQNDNQAELNLVQKIKLGVERIKNHFTK